MIPSKHQDHIVRLVIATPHTEESFFAETAAGQFYKAYRPPNVEMRLFCENTELGLPTIYNAAIEETRDKPALLVFMHDDVYLPDFFWADRIREGLQTFDILGVVGSGPRRPLQPAWHLQAQENTFALRQDGLSGHVGQNIDELRKSVSWFGPTRQKVDILDGLLLAASSETLIANDLRFDERFRFHLYDVDFCRQAEQKSLNCGTWDIATIHQSRGNYDRNWLLGLQAYFEKWGEDYRKLEFFTPAR